MDDAARLVLDRLERAGRVALYPRELCQSTGLDRVSVIDALAELQAEGLVMPATFRATNGNGRRRGLNAAPTTSTPPSSPSS